MHSIDLFHHIHVKFRQNDIDESTNFSSMRCAIKKNIFGIMCFIIIDERISSQRIMIFNFFIGFWVMTQIMKLDVLFVTFFKYTQIKISLCHL